MTERSEWIRDMYAQRAEWLATPEGAALDATRQAWMEEASKRFGPQGFAPLCDGHECWACGSRAQKPRMLSGKHPGDCRDLYDPKGIEYLQNRARRRRRMCAAGCQCETCVTERAENEFLDREYLQGGDGQVVTL